MMIITETLEWPEKKVEVCIALTEDIDSETRNKIIEKTLSEIRSIWIFNMDKILPRINQSIKRVYPIVSDISIVSLEEKN